MHSNANSTLVEQAFCRYQLYGWGVGSERFWLPGFLVTSVVTKNNEGRAHSGESCYCHYSFIKRYYLMGSIATLLRRVAIRKATMIGLEKLWQDRHVSIDTKKRIVRTLIFPTVLYGCETWTLTKKMEKKINACEMWIWRKMQRISWTEKKTNESVRMEIGIEEDETLQQTALRKLGFFGHVMRSDGLEKDTDDSPRKQVVHMQWIITKSE